MSRVRILNLPQTISEDGLRRHFVSPTASITTTSHANKADLTITDVFIVKNNKGTVRMAFLGFKTTAAANAIIAHYNGSFMGAQKLKVEPAQSVDEASKEYKEKQERLEKKRQLHEAKKEALAKKEAEAKEGDSSAAGKRKRGRESDSKEGATTTTAATSSEKGSKGKTTGEVGSRNDLLEHFVDDRTRAGPTFQEEILAPVGAPQVAAPTPAAELLAKAEEEEQEAIEKQKKLEDVSDLDFMAQLSGAKPNVVESSRTTDGNQDAMPTTATEGDEAPQQTAEAPVKLEGDDLARATRRIRVKNLPYNITELEVKNFFSSAVGPIEAVHVPLTRDTKQAKGAAFIRFNSADDAVKALKLNLSACMGRLIRVFPAELNPTDLAQANDAKELAADAEGDEAPVVDGEEGQEQEQPKKPGYKAEQAKKKKIAESQNKSSLSWNPLYMASNTAVSTMANRLDVQEKDLINVNSAGAAVRAAVAEAVLTSEAKRVLGEEGIDFGKLQNSSLHRSRSNTTILVKNLSKGVDLGELTAAFKKFGPLETIATPADPTFAIYGFIHAQDSRVAFQRLAYRKMQGQVLLLEWAPVGAVKEDVDEEEAEQAAAAVQQAPLAAVSLHTAYVTNLPFNATEDEFSVFMRDLAPRLAKDGVVQRIDLRSDRGQAFVTVADEVTLKYLVSKLQGAAFNGRTLGCQVSTATRTINDEPKLREAEPEQSTTCPPDCNPCKLIIKNLPFEATENDLRQLFASFTEVKSVRVPKKNHQFSSHRNNNHRGFGFVEFLTEQEAVNALSSLTNTHLYGRHLVLQYAKMDQNGLDGMRE